MGEEGSFNLIFPKGLAMWFSLKMTKFCIQDGIQNASRRDPNLLYPKGVTNGWRVSILNGMADYTPPQWQLKLSALACMGFHQIYIVLHSGSGVVSIMFFTVTCVMA
jgi:hypothetical protein